MESIGEQLRAARLARKLSLEDVSRATKIKVDILEKIEVDDFGSLTAPMYTKGFLKLYAQHLGLDSDAIAAAYLRSQGGLRRQGLHLETEAQIRSRRQRELQLPLGAVVRVVAVLTLIALIVGGGYYWWSHRQTGSTPPAKSASLPVAEFDAYYQPKTTPHPELLEPPTK